MPLAPATLQAVQQAGQTLHAARQAVQAEIQRHTERLVATMASQPFGAEADRSYAQLRQVARLGHELQSLEEQLAALYQSAAQMPAEEIAFVEALPDQGGNGRPAPPADVVDAQELEPRRARRQARATAPKQAPAKPARRDVPAGLACNDLKVLDFLKTVLDRRRWTSLPQSEIARQAAIPPGSVGATLRRLIASGALRRGEPGQYRLG
ncbi:MAG: hypothetical protein RJA36_29 [Pseudomonadota bacterium]|jgi:hypothetical protein